MSDHVHMLIFAEIFRGGGDRLHERKEFDLDRAERRAKARNSTGHKFRARGYFVSTVGRDEEMIRADIKNQEIQDRELDQLSMIPQSHLKSSRVL